MKKRVAVLMGGPSSEHEVSLKSGAMVMKHLNPDRFLGMPVKINRDGSWPLSMAAFKEKIDVAFIALHGEYGEDGQIQSLLDTFHVPYTGSGPVASTVAMDKIRAQVLLKQNGFAIPKYLTVVAGAPVIEWEKVKKLGLPLVIKPTNRGSSVGVQIVRRWPDFNRALADSFHYSDSLIFQQYIPGIEVTCGVLDINNIAVPLVPTEIVPKNSQFFDFKAKYTVGGSREITPPCLLALTIKKIQGNALRAHKVLGCAGMSRTDMIVGNDGTVYLLEVNTIPGLTETSLIPQAAKAMGITFPKLLDIIIDNALLKKI